MNPTGAKAIPFANWVVEHYSKVIKEHLQGRGNLSEDDLEYLIGKTQALKDDRMREAIVELIGWGDEERAELETFCAIALEVFRVTPPSRLRAAAQLVGIKSLLKDVK